MGLIFPFGTSSRSAKNSRFLLLLQKKFNFYVFHKFRLKN